MHRTTAPGATRQRAFTLLELLVAVTILAVVSILCWRGLTTLLSTRDRLQPLNGEVRALMTCLGQMERDLAQVPINGPLFALPVQPVRVTTMQGHPALQVVRLATATDGLAATAVQTVYYLVEDGALVRRSSPPQRFHATGGADLESTVLLPGVDDLQIRVWRSNLGWIAPAGDADTANTVGVEMRLLRHDGTVVRRVLAVG